jgi:hypothetical protein
MQILRRVPNFYNAKVERHTDFERLDTLVPRGLICFGVSAGAKQGYTLVMAKSLFMVRVSRIR